MRTVRNNPGFLVNVPNVMEELFGKDFPSFKSENFRPAVNIKKANDAYGIELAVPGFNKEDFNIKVDDNKLTVSAKLESDKTTEENKFSLREFKTTSFSRTFNLPENEINEDEIKANYANGILHIALPKLKDALPKEPKQISIG